jgi:hypothetical protein
MDMFKKHLSKLAILLIIIRMTLISGASLSFAEGREGNRPDEPTSTLPAADSGLSLGLQPQYVSAKLDLGSMGFHVPSQPRTLSMSHPLSAGSGEKVASAQEKTYDREAFDRALDKILNLPKKIHVTVDKTEVLPGETVKFTASAAGTLEDVVFVWSDTYQYFNKNDIKVSPDGLEIEVKIPTRYSGIFWVGVSTGVVDGRYAQSEKVSVVVKPDLSKLSLMRFSRGSQRLCAEGGRFTLTTEGAFSDGSVYDLTRHELGTTYVSSDPSIATVSPDGEVKAIKPGDVTITARNEDCGAILYLKVIPFDDEPMNIIDDDDKKEPEPGPEPGTSNSGGSSGGCSTGAAVLYAAVGGGILALAKHCA